MIALSRNLCAGRTGVREIQIKTLPTLRSTSALLMTHESSGANLEKLKQWAEDVVCPVCFAPLRVRGRDRGVHQLRSHVSGC